MRPLVVLVFLVANVASRAWFFHSENPGLTLDTLGNPDEANYLTYARELLDEGPSWLWKERSLSGPPGLTLYLAALGGSVLVAKGVSVLVSSLTLLPLLAVARRLSSDPTSARVPAIAAVLFTVGLPLVRSAPTLMTEPVNAFLVTSAVATATCAGDEGLTPRQRGLRWAISGVLLGAATSFRMTTLYFPFIVFALAGAAFAAPSIRRRLEFDLAGLLRGLAAFTLGMALVVGPVLVKNGVLFGSWKMATGAGAVLYLGADPKTDGHEPYYSQYNFDTFEVTPPYTHLEPEGDRILTRVARKEMKRNPAAFILRRIQWPLRFLIGQPVDAFAPADSLASLSGMLSSYYAGLALWTLAFRVIVVGFGLAFLITRWNTHAGFVVSATVFFYLLAFLTVFVIPRYSIPILPVLVAAAAAWFGSRRLLAPSTLAVAGGAAALVIGIASFRSVFPRCVDPSDYAEHTVRATWPDAAGGHVWRSVSGGAGLAGSDGQRMLCGPAESTLEAESPRVVLENNQIVLVPFRAGPAEGSSTASPVTAGGSPAEIQGTFQWRSPDQTAFARENRAIFTLRAGSGWAWARLNPSFSPGGDRWKGVLGAVRLTLRCASSRQLDIGTMKLLKDYRMVGAAR